MPFPVLLSTLIRSRFQAKPATLLYPLIFPFFFAVEELYGTRYQSGSFSFINVGSGFHCLRSFPPPDAHPHSSIFWLARMETLFQFACQTLLTPANQVIQQETTIFSDLNAVKAHIHFQHKLGPKSSTVSNHQSTKCYTKIPINDQGKNVEKFARVFFGKRVTSGEKKLPSFAAQI